MIEIKINVRLSMPAKPEPEDAGRSITFTPLAGGAPVKCKGVSSIGETGPEAVLPLRKTSDGGLGALVR